jgi:hypothetical protein
MHPVFLFLDHNAEQFEKATCFFGQGLFGRFHEAFRRAEQSVIFSHRPDDRWQGFTEEVRIAAFV